MSARSGLGARPAPLNLMRPVSLLAFTAKPNPRLIRNRRRDQTQIYAALDPYKTLGVSPGDDEKTIKKAHRRLVLEHHPDLKAGEEGIEAKFMAIQEAYEILIGRRRGKEVEKTAGWDLHDWYWKFSMRRRKGGAAQASSPPPEVLRDQWKQQLSGLRAKAAAKRQSSRSTARTAHARNPSEAASSSVWRSATKNARKTQQATSASAPSAAFAAHQPAAEQQQRLQPLQEVGASPSTPVEEPEPAHAYYSSTDNDVIESLDEPALKTAERPSQHTFNHPQEKQQEEQHQPWRSLLTKVVQSVHEMRHRHEERIQSHISSIGDKLSQRIHMRASLRDLLPTEAADFASAEAGPLRHLRRQLNFSFKSGASAGGLPNDHELHILFADGGLNSECATATNTDSKEYSHASSSSRDRHSRKFADKQHVQSRLSHQLTGLKRRAELKREFGE